MYKIQSYPLFRFCKKKFVIYSYIKRQIFSTLLISAVILICLLWLTQSLRFLEFIINYNISLSVYLFLIVFLIPDLTSLVLPFCGLISAVTVYYRLIIRHEFLVMQSLGLSVFKLAKPVVVMGGFITIVSLGLNVWITPYSFRALRDLEHHIRKNLSSIFLTPGAFTSLKGITFYSDKSLKNQNYKILLIDLPRPSPSIVVAEKGHFDHKIFTLTSGYRHTINKQDTGIETFAFEELVYNLSGLIDVHYERLIKPHERSICDLIYPPFCLAPHVKKSLLLEGHQKIIMPFLSLIDVLVFVLFFLVTPQTRRAFHKSRFYGVFLSVIAIHLGFYSLINVSIKKDFSLLVPYISYVLLFVFLMLVLIVKNSKSIIKFKK